MTEDSKPLEGQYIPPGEGDWTVKDTGSIIADINEAIRQMREMTFKPNPPYYAGPVEYDWLVSQGVREQHLRLMEPLHIGVDLASGPDRTAVASSISGTGTVFWYDEMGRYQHLHEFVDVKTPVIGERRLPSPKAAQKAKAKRRAQKRARKR